MDGLTYAWSAKVDRPNDGHVADNSKLESRSCRPTGEKVSQDL